MLQDKINGLQSKHTELVDKVRDAPNGSVARSVNAVLERIEAAKVKAADTLGIPDPLPGLLSELFGEGQEGAFYLPQPKVNGKQVLFQDAAGTIPVTADGDPVGLMKDLSPNGFDGVQPVSARRTIYRTNGELHWLDHDGSAEVEFYGFPISSGYFDVLLSLKVKESHNTWGSIFTTFTTGSCTGLYRRGESGASEYWGGKLTVHTPYYTERETRRSPLFYRASKEPVFVKSERNLKSRVKYPERGFGFLRYGTQRLPKGLFYGAAVMAESTESSDSYIASLVGVQL